MKEVQYKGMKKKNDETELRVVYTSLEVIPAIRK